MGDVRSPHSPTAPVFAVATLSLLGAAHCGGALWPTEAPGDDAGGASAAADGGPGGRGEGGPAGGDGAGGPSRADGAPVPLAVGRHRSVAGTCPPSPDAGGGADGCLSDGDCPSGDVCSCSGNPFGWDFTSPYNACVAGNCRIDSQCATGFCSPSSSARCGPPDGVAGWYCHTPDDLCGRDQDCVSDPIDGGSQAGYCAYDPAVGHWACGYVWCSK
jgi:hypothetical protein